MKSRFRFDLHMYCLLLQISLRSMAQYRADLIASFFGVFLLNAANLAQIGILSWRFHDIAGWSAGELMILYGLFLICHSVFTMFFFPFYTLGQEILDGTFDRYLIRPFSPFLQFLGGKIRYVGICDLVLGLLLIFAGKTMLQVRWTTGDLLLLLLQILCGSISYISLRLVLSCFSFWKLKASSLHSILQQLTLLTQKYPISIFGGWLQFMVTGPLPIAFINYYPAVILLHKSDEPAWLCLLSPAIAVCFVALAAFLWKKGIHRYASAGG